MPRSNRQMIKNLQRAINEKFGVQLLLDRTQFYSEEQDRPVTIWKIKKPAPEELQNKSRKYYEVFSTTSQIQIVLWLRDCWYELNGWDIPTDNPVWEKAKQHYAEKKNKQHKK